MAASVSVCRYFANGVCSKGNRCRYSHDQSSMPKDVCLFYQSGKCSFGNTCCFIHSKTKPSNSEVKDLKNQRQKIVQLPKTELNAGAPEFIPSWKKREVHSYATAVCSAEILTEEDRLAALKFCPYYETTGECLKKDDDCPFAHGDFCDMCQKWCLHPYNECERTKHIQECTDNHQRAMEQAFFEKKSMDKMCGICMENIFEKNLRFGILNGCKHCFCLDCIRQWRSKHQSEELDSKVVRSCPECRQHSDYVVPSVIWVEEEEEKTLLIEMYKENTKSKVCKYYNGQRNIGNCPFGNKCFYKHQLPDGSIDPGESPHLRRRPRLSEWFGVDDSDDDDEDQINMEIYNQVVRALRF